MGIQSRYLFLDARLLTQLENFILLITQETAIEIEEYVPTLAIVGRPNVGKSSILNALVGEDRTVVSPISGTTRDAIDMEFTDSDGQVSPILQ